MKNKNFSRFVKGATLTLIFILLINIAAAEVEVVKQVNKNFNFNEEIKVTIKIANKGPSSSFEIKERLPSDIELINPSKPNQITYLNGIQAEFLKYSLEIPENKISTIEYTFKPKSLGSYTISPTSVSSDAVYLSNSAEFTVSCIPDGTCSDAENNLYCPEDCSTSIPDGICNPKLDSSCDPDCESDPDCKGSQGSSFSFKLLLIPLAVILVLIIIYVIYRILKRNKHPLVQQFEQNNQQPQNQQSTQQSTQQNSQSSQSKENDILKGL
ncbi:hypothetical protein J4405_04585 [Candidatus Woesearchaeota archaeon]|nr:hypothetical protein [Candidatus Woesearchaeota archaeon]